MKIINFSVNNYRCLCGGLESNTVNFDGSNTIFIFGQNNTGKSSFLNAYVLFYEDERVEKSDFCNQDITKPIEIVIEVELTNEEKSQFKGKKTNAEEKYFYEGNKLKLKKIWNAPNQDSDNHTYEKQSSKFVDKGYAGVGEHNVFKAMLPKPIFIEAMPSEEDLESIVNEILSIKVKELLKKNEDKEYREAMDTIRKLQSKAYDNEDIKHYKEGVNKHFNLMFNDINISIKEKDPLNVLKAIEKKFTINFDHLDADKSIKEEIPSSLANIGHGAIRVALFSLFLMKDFASSSKPRKDGKNYIVLFEEPELFLHPKLTKLLRNLIYEVSSDSTPFQLLCASHSPQMIDLTKPKTSIVRIVKNKEYTKLYQVDETILTDGKDKVKQEIYEALRFNPYICEAFYADEVLLIEGDAEAIILRGYLQEKEVKKDLFVLNCGTVNNIPFFQKIFSKFNITYHIIFDTDNNIELNNGITKANGIQKTIIDQYESDKSIKDYKIGVKNTHNPTFEPAHKDPSIPQYLQFPFATESKKGNPIKKDKPYNANEYWKTILSKELDNIDIDKVPIIRYIKEIIAFS